MDVMVTWKKDIPYDNWTNITIDMKRDESTILIGASSVSKIDLPDVPAILRDCTKLNIVPYPSERIIEVKLNNSPLIRFFIPT